MNRHKSRQLSSRSELYAILDTQLLKRYSFSIESFLERIKSFKELSMLQYRNKNATIREKREDLVKIRSIYSGTLIVNDEIKLIEFADGIHLGQEDLLSFDKEIKEAIEIIRERVGSKIVGISTHNKEEVEVANELNIDYIGVGAYRSTSTKKDALAKGEEILKIAKLSRHPVAIIGGVKLKDRFGKEIRYKAIASDLLKSL